MTFQRLMLVIASANGFQVFTDEIENAHLYTDSDLKTFTRVGPEFEFAGYNELKYGSLAKIVRALSCLPTIGRAWHLLLLKHLGVWDLRKQGTIGCLYEASQRRPKL